MVKAAKALGDLVDLVGIEPTTSSMPWKRAPSCATGPLSENPILEHRQKGRIHSRPHYSDSQRAAWQPALHVRLPGGELGKDLRASGVIDTPQRRCLHRWPSRAEFLSNRR